MKKLLGALAALLTFAWSIPAHADEPISWLGTVTLDTGVTAFGKVAASLSNPMPVQIVTGSLLSNFALENGGNLAAAKADLDSLVAAASNPAPLVGTNGSTVASPSNPLDVAPRASAAGGATSFGLQSAASTNSTNVKNAAGVLYGMNLFNSNTTVYYLRMYDSAAAPTCSSSTGFVRSWPIPPASSAGLIGGVAVSLPSVGTQFSSGISFCVTGGPSSTDNTNAATGVFINMDYK
jgi:hypothetical protein